MPIFAASFRKIRNVYIFYKYINLITLWLMCIKAFIITMSNTEITNDFDWDAVEETGFGGQYSEAEKQKCLQCTRKLSAKSQKKK